MPNGQTVLIQELIESIQRSDCQQRLMVAQAVQLQPRLPSSKLSIKVQYGSYRIYEVREPSSDLQDSKIVYQVAGYVIPDLENYCLSETFGEFKAAMEKNQRIQIDFIANQSYSVIPALAGHRAL